MDINFFFNWVFYEVSIEKKNPRRQSPQGKLQLGRLIVFAPFLIIIIIILIILVILLSFRAP